MPRRRTPGDGSIWKRTRTSPNGRTYTRWVAQLSVGPRHARRNVKRVKRTYREAEDALKELLDPTSEKPALGDYLRRWLDETARPTIAPNTAAGYESVIASLAPLHDVKLDELTAEDVEGWLNGLTAKRRGQRKAHPASPKTKCNALAMLRRALSVAVKRDHVERNVALLVDMPRVPRIQRAAMTPELARGILEATKKDRYAAAYALAFCAMRQGEILGLAWEDVDLDAGTADVRWQLVGSGRSAKRAQLKTKASEAPIVLPPFVIERLRAHRKAQAAERLSSGQPTEDGLVFVTARGFAVSGSYLTKHFQELLTTAGLPKLRMHDLRHATASLLAEAGVHPSIAQRYLRHATVGMTLGTYTHTTSQQERAAADALEGLIAGDAPGYAPPDEPKTPEGTGGASVSVDLVGEPGLEPGTNRI